MCNQDYEIYKNIMSANPIITDDYIRGILHLSKKQSLNHVEVTEVIESNTALIIKVCARIIDEDAELTKKLFIKTIKRNKSDNAYHQMSMRESKFYQLIKDNSVKDLPISECYDVFVSDEKGEFVIVLEDISNQYTAPDSDVFADKEVWFSCAEVLARFHSALWNKGLTPQDENETEHDAQSDRDSLKSFIQDFNDRLDSNTKATLEKAMEINLSLIKETKRRKHIKSNVTVCNGDSHIYNFMLPIDRSKSPLMVDFQFWGTGIGTGDLAHLTRESFSDELKKDIQVPLVKHYYKTLAANGVVGYSWEDCFQDYRTSVASMVLIPLWQYTGFGLKYEEWIGDLRGLIYNYEYLKCDELYHN